MILERSSRLPLQPFGSPSVTRIPIVTCPGRRFAFVKAVMPRSAASIGVPSRGPALLSVESKASLGNVVYEVAGTAALSYGAPVPQLNLSLPEKNWRAAL